MVWLKVVITKPLGVSAIDLLLSVPPETSAPQVYARVVTQDLAEKYDIIEVLAVKEG